MASGKITASKLRENVYRILDEVLKKGVPIEIERKGKKLKIVPVQDSKKTSRLLKRNIINGAPQDLVHIDWSGEWKAD